MEFAMKPIVRIEEAKIIDTTGVWARISDGREITIPTIWFKRLSHKTPEQLAKFELSPYGIHWEELDEDISINAFLFGLPEISYVRESIV